jgi:hypothetical protein
MQVQSALLFETPEEIFARVHAGLRPGAACPAISIQVRAYANANSSVRLRAGRIEVRLADVLAGAPAPVLEALAWILLAKLYRVEPSKAAVYSLRRYLNRKDVRRQLHLLRQARGRKFVSGPQGRRWNLDELFDSLNLRFFDGLLGKPALGWSRGESRTLLGHFDPSHNAIVLSRVLDGERASRSAVEYVLFHEMLHLRYPAEHRGARRCVHTEEFKRAEKAYPGLGEAKAEIKRLLTQS